MRKLTQPSKTAQKNKSPVPKVFISEFCQTFKKDLIPILLKLFQKIGKAILPNTFYEANITLIPKPGEDNTKIKLQTNRNAKTLNKILAN